MNIIIGAIVVILLLLGAVILKVTLGILGFGLNVAGKVLKGVLFLLVFIIIVIAVVASIL